MCPTSARTPQSTSYLKCWQFRRLPLNPIEISNGIYPKFAVHINVMSKSHDVIGQTTLYYIQTIKSSSRLGSNVIRSATLYYFQTIKSSSRLGTNVIRWTTLYYICRPLKKFIQTRALNVKIS